MLGRKKLIDHDEDIYSSEHVLGSEDSGKELSDRGSMGEEVNTSNDDKNSELVSEGNEKIVQSIENSYDGNGEGEDMEELISNERFRKIARKADKKISGGLRVFFNMFERP